MRRFYYIFCLVFLTQTAVVAQAVEENYGANRLSFSPMMAYGSSSFNDVGIGIGYEHFFNSKVGLQSDFSYGLNNEMLQFMVGPKFYPRTNENVVTYGVSPVLIVSRGEDLVNHFDIYEPFVSGRRLRTYSQFGFMLINSVNMTLKEKIYFGLEAGLGINYLNRYKTENSDDVSENDPGGNRLIRIKMGYRF